MNSPASLALRDPELAPGQHIIAAALLCARLQRERIRPRARLAQRVSAHRIRRQSWQVLSSFVRACPSAAPRSPPACSAHPPPAPLPDRRPKAFPRPAPNRRTIPRSRQTPPESRSPSARARTACATAPHPYAALRPCGAPGAQLRLRANCRTVSRKSVSSSLNCVRR